MINDQAVDKGENLDLRKDPDYSKMSPREKARTREALLAQRMGEDPELATLMKDPNQAIQVKHELFKSWDPEYDTTPFSDMPDYARVPLEVGYGMAVKAPAQWLGGLMRGVGTYESPLTDEEGNIALDEGGWAITERKPFEDWRKPIGELGNEAIEQNEPVTLAEKYGAAWGNLGIVAGGPMVVGRWSAFLPVAARVTADVGTAVLTAKMLDTDWGFASVWGAVAAYNALKIPPLSKTWLSEVEASRAVNRYFKVPPESAVTDEAGEVIINPGNGVLQEHIVSKSPVRMRLQATARKNKRVMQRRTLIANAPPGLSMDPAQMIQDVLQPRISALDAYGKSTQAIREMWAAQLQKIQSWGGRVTPQQAYQMLQDADTTVAYVSAQDLAPGAHKDLIKLRDGYSELLSQMIPGARALGRRIIELDVIEKAAKQMQHIQVVGQGRSDIKIRESIGPGGVRATGWVGLRDLFLPGPTTARLARWLHPMRDPDFDAIMASQIQLPPGAGGPWAGPGPTIPQPPLGLPPATSLKPPPVGGLGPGPQPILPPGAPNIRVGQPSGPQGPFPMRSSTEEVKVRLQFQGAGPQRQIIGGKEVVGSLPPGPPAKQIKMLGTNAVELPGGGYMTSTGELIKAEGEEAGSLFTHTPTPITRGQASRSRTLFKAEERDPLKIKGKK